MVKYQGRLFDAKINSRAHTHEITQASNQTIQSSKHFIIHLL
jgi:hypothetical protein